MSYDVSWSFLLSMLRILGFGEKWIGWIHHISLSR